MKKKRIDIIDFLELPIKKYEKILEYRNQLFVRKASFNKDIITLKDHWRYYHLLKDRNLLFAFLIQCEKKDFGVIFLKKVTNKIYTNGAYLVNIDSSYEGGGIVLEVCLTYIGQKIGVKYNRYAIRKNNKKGLQLSKYETPFDEDSRFYYFEKKFEYYANLADSKFRKSFEKLYYLNTD